MKPLKKTALFAGSALILALGVNTLTTQSPKAADSLNKAEVEKIVREYLVENPEVVINAIESYQANQAEIDARRFQEKISSMGDSLYQNETSPFVGNPDADVVIVEFFDYNCGYCKKAAAEVQEILDTDKNVKIVFKDMPILSAVSHTAARYSLAADKQDKYFEYHMALMNHRGSMAEGDLQNIAKKIGLDADKLKEDADSAAVKQKIEQNLALSRQLGIRGTPAFVIGDMLSPGYMSLDDMKMAIENARNE